jgi:hypothetical protein
LVTAFATILVLTVFAVQGLKLNHALIHSALCVLDWSIVLIGYYLFNMSSLSTLKLILGSIDPICMGNETAGTHIDYGAG